MIRWVARVAAVGMFMWLLCAPGASALEGRIMIPFVTPVAFPIGIGGPGKFLLSANLTPAGGGVPVIAIALPAIAGPGQVVDLDLGGFVLNNVANGGNSVITITGPPTAEVHIRNGSMVGGMEGISLLGGIRKVVIEDVQVGNTAGAGIHLTGPANFAIRRAAVFTAGGTGILIDNGGAVVLKQGVIEDTLVNGTVNGIAVYNANGLILKKNQIRSITPGPVPGGGPSAAISLSVVEPCLVSQNTIDGVTGAAGIATVDAEGCKFEENAISDTGMDGIVLDAISSDNFLLHNIVRGAFGDGVHIFGVRNSVEANVLGNNGRVTGVGFGLHFGAGASLNRFGRNSSAANAGGPCAFVVNAEYCDDNGAIGAINFSFSDNMMPGPATF